MERQELITQLEQYISSHERAIVEDLKSLVRFPSVSVEGTEETPFGEECAKVLDFALDMAKERGFLVNKSWQLVWDSLLRKP